MISQTSKKLLSTSANLGSLFLLILTHMHFLAPQFDPSWRMISEYEIGEFGWLMRLAFFCWGGGYLLLTLSLWNLLETTSGKVGNWWLLIISIALFGAGVFAPQPITDLVRETTDKLHTLCGAIMIFTFPIAASLIARSLSKRFTNATSRRPLTGLTILVWIGFAAFFCATILYAPQAKSRAYGPDTLIGWPNRFMVLTYTIWLIGVARMANKTTLQRAAQT